MELKQAFDTVMETTINMALATSVNDRPNVRVVTYGYDPRDPKVVYFTTFKGNQKIEEFEQNERVTLMPLPENPESPAQIRIFGTVQKAEKSLDDVAELILKKAPFFAETLTQREFLETYEVVFDEAAVTIGMQDAQTLIL